MVKKITFTLCSLLLTMPAIAGQNSKQSVIDAFTNCDSSFFYQLKNNIEDFKPLIDLIEKDNIAYIAVEDSANPNKDIHYFSTPISYRGLSLIGFQNTYIETPLLGQYYYWGFVIDNNADEVKEALNQFNWLPFSETSDIANSKIYDRQAKKPYWENNPYSVDGIAPKLMTIEQSLKLITMPDGSKTKLICSIQGDIQDEFIYRIRPDMKFIDAETLEKQQQEQRQNSDNNTDNLLETTIPNNEEGF